jgi:hypothetical protein
MRPLSVLLLVISACDFPKPADVPGGETDDARIADAWHGDAVATDASGAHPSDAPLLGFDHQRTTLTSLLYQPGPDGLRVYQLFSVRLDGTDTKQMTNVPYIDDGGNFPFGAQTGTVSVDGRYLVFVERKPDSSSLVVQNIDGTGRRVMSPTAPKALRRSVWTDSEWRICRTMVFMS